jgi:hypothetical protein
LKLECDGLLSNFGFKFNLRRYTKVAAQAGACSAAVQAGGLQSSTSQLNLSRF